MAKTKAKGKVNQKSQRKRRGKHRGIKLFSGQTVEPGNIIVRQLGSRFHPGPGTKMGRDFTIYADRKGIIKFKNKRDNKLVCVY
jgi:large subunit ribosomal protein L27